MLKLQNFSALHPFSARPAAGKEGNQPSERIMRLGREMAGLSADLALSASSSAFARVDADQVLGGGGVPESS
jgi:hypothetical protein